MTTPKLPPYLQSEVSSRLREAIGPDMVAALDQKRLPISGEELESLLCAAFVIGYGHGADDGPNGEIGRYLLEHHT